MSVDKIKALAETVNTFGLTRLELTEGDVKIVIEKVAQVVPSTQSVVANHSPLGSADVDSVSDEETVNFNKMIEIKSPIVGVFYAAPTPESAPFVSIGSKVQKGDVLCIVEAMKLLNEITAEQDGEIIDICIKNGDITEFGQILFKMI